MVTIIQAETPEHIDEARRIFIEYEKWLGVSLCFQNFQEEMDALPGKYASPAGRLLIAVENGEIAGCVAFRPINKKTCEMKRLFVRERFQGSGLGRQLLKRLISEAKNAGYKKKGSTRGYPEWERQLRCIADMGFARSSPTTRTLTK